MKKLKIGVLTFHRCINYGSFWQASSLAAALAQKGHEVVILDHQSTAVNFSEWKCALQPVLPTHVPPEDRPFYRKKIESFFEAFKQMPLSAPFPLDRPDLMEACDMVVVGSDEVWNLAHPWYGGCPLFYGEGLTAPLVIAYAASFGNYHSHAGLGAEWMERLRNFDMISVRDLNSRQLVTAAVGAEPELVLDPCLLYPLTPEPRVHQHLPHDYIAVYGHNFSSAFVVQVRRYATQKGLPLVSIGYRNDWADVQWIDADPHDFVHAIKNSTAAATNFFHGCVFALRFARPFACETTPYRSIKVTSLMEKVGGLHHLVTENSSATVYEKVLGEPPEPYILHHIDQLRKTSDAFLDRSLNLKQYQYA